MELSLLFAGFLIWCVCTALAAARSTEADWPCLNPKDIKFPYLVQTAEAFKSLEASMTPWHRFCHENHDSHDSELLLTYTACFTIDWRVWWKTLARRYLVLVLLCARPLGQRGKTFAMMSSRHILMVMMEWDFADVFPKFHINVRAILRRYFEADCELCCLANGAELENSNGDFLLVLLNLSAFTDWSYVAAGCCLGCRAGLLKHRRRDCGCIVCQLNFCEARYGLQWQRATHHRFGGS